MLLEILLPLALALEPAEQAPAQEDPYAASGDADAKKPADEAAKTTKGSVEFEGERGAMVFLEGRYLAKLPATVELEPGVYTFEIQKRDGMRFHLTREITFEKPDEALKIDLNEE